MNEQISPGQNHDPTKNQHTDILPVNLPDKDALYAAYMPFIKGGALFVATDKTYKIGDEVFVLLKLLDEPDKYSIAAKVVWVNPPRALGRRSAGVGVQFIHEGASQLRTTIETYLAGFPHGDKPTETI